MESAKSLQIPDKIKRNKERIETKTALKSVQDSKNPPKKTIGTFKNFIKKAQKNPKVKITAIRAKLQIQTSNPKMPKVKAGNDNGVSALSF